MRSSIIITLPDERLKKKSAPAEAITPRIVRVAALLDLALDRIGHAVGIAASQIGENLRIVAVDAGKAKRPCRNRGRMILVNPEITKASGKIVFREGCMSVPGFHAQVERARDIVVKALVLDIDILVGAAAGMRRKNLDIAAALRGGFVSQIAFSSSGFEAVILQHEIDHLDGILFIDRIKRVNSKRVNRK